MRFLGVLVSFGVLNSVAGLWGGFDDEIDDLLNRLSDDEEEPVVEPTQAPSALPPVAAVVSPQTAPTTTRRPIEVRRHMLALTPRFLFGALQFRHPRRVREDQVALCPTDKGYCIDTRHSDAATCMYPSPIEIKRCLDRSCLNAPENPQIFAQYGEPSYCKDYMAMPEGRICHWGTTFCSCPEFGIEYADALIQLATDPVPSGFASVGECHYPLDYKADNDYNGAGATLAPVPTIGGGAGVRRGPKAQSPKQDSGAASAALLTAALVAALL